VLLLTCSTLWEKRSFQAEEHRKREVETIVFPQFAFAARKRGAVVSAQDRTREREAMSLHVSKKVSLWFDTKHKAVETAEGEYKKILQIEPAPPPRWVIAAASRVGFMWGDLYVALTRPVAARQVAIDPEQRAMYLSIVSTTSTTIGARAKAAFEMCAALSVRYQYADRYSESCHAWLAWYDPKHHVAVDELMPRAVMQSTELIPMGALAEPVAR